LNRVMVRRRMPLRAGLAVEAVETGAESAMAKTDVEVIESTAGQVAAELSRRGIDPARLVTVIVEPEDWLTRGRRDSQPRIAAAGLSDSDVDAVIKEARREANEDMRRGVTPPAT
jgi:hypothetical protein